MLYVSKRRKTRSTVLRADSLSRNRLASYQSRIVSFPAGGNMSLEEHYELGMSRESWCSVERMKEEAWCRANRKHYPNLHLKSSVLAASTPEEEPRCTWSVDKPTHKERRHFQENGKRLISSIVHCS